MPARTRASTKRRPLLGKIGVENPVSCQIFRHKCATGLASKRVSSTPYMIHLQGIAKNFGGQKLFDRVDAQIGLDSKIALIGANGAGKSTLIKLILGVEGPDAGVVKRAKRVQIGHLAQEVPKFSGRSVLAEVVNQDTRLEDWKNTKTALEESFQDAEPSAEDLQRYAKVVDELEHYDEIRREARAKEILQGMGFTDPHRNISEFSGGWLMRVAMSRILLQAPDLIILDEPTNHLDLESLLWMENYLSQTDSALLIVSHDLEFLQRVTNEVWEIENQQLFTYRGSIPDYVEEKILRQSQLQASFEQQQKQIAALENFVRRFGAKATKAKQAQSRVKQLEKMDRIELKSDQKKIQFRFLEAPHSGKIILTAEKMDFSYPEQNIFHNMNWTIPRGARIAIVGQNGVGKTTLLKLLAGVLKPTQGKLTYGSGVQLGYYAQIHAEALQGNRNILEELLTVAPPHITPQYIRNLAGSFLFSGSTIEKKCNVLSGGEKARVALAKLLLQPSNFLLLDEPTNHLDVTSKEMLLEALEDFEGTLCIVSHDRAFMEPLVDSVLEIIPGKDGAKVDFLTESYVEYVLRKKSQASGALSGLTKTESTKDPQKITRDNSEGKISNNKKQAWKKELTQVEAEIQKIESILEQITGFLSDPQNYEQKTELKEKIRQQVEQQKKLQERYSKWEELVQALEQADKNG